MMSVGSATTLVTDLRLANANDLSDWLEHETDRARRFAESAS
jgi:hypothetical protein